MTACACAKALRANLVYIISARKSTGKFSKMTLNKFNMRMADRVSIGCCEISKRRQQIVRANSRQIIDDKAARRC